MPPLSAVQRTSPDTSTPGQPSSSGSTLASGTTPAPAQGPRALAELTRFDLPLLDTGIDQAWQLVDDSELDPSIVKAWADNGLRVGVLKRNQWQAFVEGLPQAVNARIERFLFDGRQTMLLASRSLTRAVDMTLRDDEIDSMASPLSRGRLQLLIRLVATADGMASVIEITPQHHLPRPSIEPRTEPQKLLDGRVFHELALRAKLPEGTLLLIYPDLPTILVSPVPPVPPPEARDADGIEVDTAVDGDDDGQTEVKPEEEPGLREKKESTLNLPNHFGRWLLTASRIGKPVRMLVVVAVAPGG